MGGRRRIEEMESSSSDDETEDFTRELSEVTLGELQEIRQKVGTRKFDSALKKSKAEREKRSFKRANKNRPRELSSKKPVSRFREVVSVPKKPISDPRFDESCGSYNEDLFQKTYSFINEMKKKEKLQVQKELRKTKKLQRKKELEMLLQKMESREAAAAKKEEEKAILREHKKVEKELAKKGKKPFHMKKSTVKKIVLAKKYSALKKSGKLEKFVERKRRKNAKRDRKQLPVAGR